MSEIVSMIPNVENVFKNQNITNLTFFSAYNPLINYDWSTTTTSGLRYLKDIGSTPAYNASMYFGRGAYLNGVDQSITVPINTTIQTALKRVNGVVTISETSQTLTNYVISGLGVHKDYYLFTRLLTTSEKDSYTNTPELFYAMAQADSTCVLNMPMCETSSTVRNYKTGIDYSITNYTSSVRDNAKNLQYGLQTCKFVRNSSGVIQSTSNYLECDGIGYVDTSYLPIQNSIFTIEVCLASYNSTKTFGIGVEYNKVRIVISSINVYIQANQTNGGILIQGNYVQGTYKNVTLVYNKGTLKGYINGVLIGTKSGLVLTDTQSIPIGYTSEHMGIGNVRLFKVHDKELTQAEITANYNSYVAKGLLS